MDDQIGAYLIFIFEAAVLETNRKQLTTVHFIDWQISCAVDINVGPFITKLYFANILPEKGSRHVRGEGFEPVYHTQTLCMRPNRRKVKELLRGMLIDL